CDTVVIAVAVLHCVAELQGGIVTAFHIVREAAVRADGQRQTGVAVAGVQDHILVGADGEGERLAGAIGRGRGNVHTDDARADFVRGRFGRILDRAGSAHVEDDGAGASGIPGRQDQYVRLVRGQI